MNLTIRKRAEQQVELMPSSEVRALLSARTLATVTLVMALVLTLIPCPAGADIYRFVTIDGVETFTDAPSDKSATVVIKDNKGKAGKKKSPSKKQKTHDISLDEIAQKVIAASLNNQAPEQPFECHLPAVGGVITSKVGMRIDPIDGVLRHHNGIDIAIPSGTAVKPVAAGVVAYSGKRSGYGNTVIIEHNNGVITLYAHNSQLLVEQGQQVSADSTIALSGSTGRSTGPHLHFEAWQAGANVTEAFLPNSGISLPSVSLIASSRQPIRFRSEALSDGSILFTNLPESRP